MTEPTVHQFQAEVSQVLNLVINSLYSHKEIFLRELVSNAADAVDRLRFRAIREPELLEPGQELKIRLIPDAAAGTLTIWDNGVGMSAEELSQNLGTIAWSGSRKFLEQLESSQKNAESSLKLIGQFGVGFYSAYLVADDVEVVSRAAGSDQAHRWRSSGRDQFTIEPAERDAPGTSVILHLKADQRDFLDRWRLRDLIARYSDYIDHPIELLQEQKAEGAGEPEFERINRASALWQRSPQEVQKEQYEEFYKHLTHDFEAPLTYRHFKIEGTQMFAGIVFVPRRPPLDAFDPNPRHGIRLHVRRVFVMDDCEELVPRWLRFVRGVVDSEDLPLNVSRELLQDSRAVRIIKKQIVQQTLDALAELAKERPDDYETFWRAFGAVLKEGLHFDVEHKDRLSELLRFEIADKPGLHSLEQYVEAMAEDQASIYYATGPSASVLLGSPHLEALRRRGYPVLLMTDPVDAFAVEGLKEYRGKKLVSAMNADLELGPPPAAENASEAPKASTGLLETFQRVLGDRVKEVRASERLTDSPVCLVMPSGGLDPHMERMLRAQNLKLPETKRIFEVNLGHPLVRSLEELGKRDEAQLGEYVELLYDQALLAEGSPVADPSRFARRVADLMALAARGTLGAAAPRDTAAEER